MLDNFKELLQDLVTTSLKEFSSSDLALPFVEIETPSDKSHGEFSTNIALKSAKVFKKPPLEMATQLCKAIQKKLKASPLKQKIEKVETDASDKPIEKQSIIKAYVK